ncbi:hypothetical protein [Oceanobacillus jeddahense]|uniref:hypothetical protein n=1 Tax=Oceanobacillus jeddahense TaxID=1462527 RepID=UPI000595D5BA|nr:hypothetical protein [Oceanobacillus jeddahense]
MRTYLIFAHVLNIFLLFPVGFLGLLLFMNISEPGNIPPVSPIDIGIVITMLVMWTVSYWYQIWKKEWGPLLVANLIFLVALFVLIVMIMPFLFDIFY